MTAPHDDARRVALTEGEHEALLIASHTVEPVQDTGKALFGAVERILADRLAAAEAAAECHVCADLARVVALVERSSLGGTEAKAVRESVPNEIGIAIARAADYLGRAERAEAAAEEARATVARVQTVIDTLGALHPDSEIEAAVQDAYDMALRAALAGGGQDET